MADTDYSSPNRSDHAGSSPVIPGSFPGSPQGATGSNHFSLSQAIHARRAEYVRPKTIRIKVGTWNTASFKDTQKDVGAWFVHGEAVSDHLNRLSIASDSTNKDSQDHETSKESAETVNHQEERFEEGKPTVPKPDPGALPAGSDIGLYLLGLQEIVNVTSASENFRPYTDQSPAKTWKAAVEAALPKGYVLVAEQQLVGLFLLIYASPEVAPDVRSVNTTSVGTGIMGYLGNKGAVTARLVLGETTRVVFVNSHLAAGADKAALERRNWDYEQIIQRTRFEPIKAAMDLEKTRVETLNDADFAFWTGDLNYRIAEIPGNDVRHLLMLHTRNEYDLNRPSSKKLKEVLADTETRGSMDSQRPSSSGSVKSGISDTKSDGTGSNCLDGPELEPSADSASLQTTLLSLLPHDELQQQIKARKAFHEGWQEGPITFLPTYKYDPGSVGVFDSSEKKRAPSWCDRILYRTRRDKLAYDSKIAEEKEAAKKDAEMKRQGLDHAASEEELLYDYDPDEDGADDYNEEEDYEDKPEGVVITQDGYEDELHLEHYTSHQRVLSSDHKPLDAVFRLKYDCVVPKLRAQVYQEVVRELDKAENEGRPTVTVIVDKHHHDDHDINDRDPINFEGADFGHVMYAARKHRSLTIANTGRVPATIMFVDRPVGAGQDEGPSPRWLKVSMDSDETGESKHHITGPRTLKPGDVCHVDMKVWIKGRHITKALNEGLEQLDDILVLRVDDGRDHFIPVRGRWVETTVGHSIEKLIRIPEGGIRKLQQQKPKGRHRHLHLHRLSDEPVRWSAPRELFRLSEATEKLTEACIAEWEMVSQDEEAPWVTTAGWPFEESSWKTTLEQRQDLTGAVCEALDTGKGVMDCMPLGTPKMDYLETLADFLLEYLDSMPDGVITDKLWNMVQEVLRKDEHKKDESQEDICSKIQEVLSDSPPHSISFILLTSTIQRIIGEQISSTLRSTKHEDFKVPPPLVRSATGSLRKKDISKEPKTAYRQIIVRRMAQIFGRVIVHAEEPNRSKERAALEEQKTKFVELFISRTEP